MVNEPLIVNCQDWRCEKCATFGSVRFCDGDSVSSVRNRIEAAHEKAAEWCAEMWGLSYVRLAADA